jgi:hypothetical protein
MPFRVLCLLVPGSVLLVAEISASRSFQGAAYHGIFSHSGIGTSLLIFFIHFSPIHRVTSAIVKLTLIKYYS